MSRRKERNKMHIHIYSQTQHTYIHICTRAYIQCIFTISESRSVPHFINRLCVNIIYAAALDVHTYIHVWILCTYVINDAS